MVSAICQYLFTAFSTAILRPRFRGSLPLHIVGRMAPPCFSALHVIDHVTRTGSC